MGPGVSVPSSNLPNPIVGSVGGSSASAFDDILKVTPPALVAFLANLPAVEGELSTYFHVVFFLQKFNRIILMFIGNRSLGLTANLHLQSEIKLIVLCVTGQL